MNNLIQYLVESSGCMLLFFCVYWVFMRRDTLFMVNRIYLIGIAFFSILLPLVPINILSAGHIPDLFVNLEPVIITPDKIEAIAVKHFQWFEIVGKIYFCGVILFLLRFVLQIIQLSLLVYRNGITKYHGLRLVFIDRQYAPFSFFNLIFIDGKEIQNKSLKIVLIHERIHIQQVHTLDLMFLEILTIIFWFNPFIWLITRDLKSIHEFLADEGVLKTGYKKLDYQELILNETIGIQVNALTNNFNVSLLKKRIHMMTKNRSSAWRKTKLIFVLPALMAIIVVLSANNYKTDPSDGNNTGRSMKNTISLGISDQEMDKQIMNDTLIKTRDNKEKEVFTVAEKLPSYTGGQMAMAKFLMDNIKYPLEALQKGITGTVFVSFIVRSDGTVTDVKLIKGIGGGCDDEALRVVKLMPKWIPGEQKGKKVDVQFTIPIKFMTQLKDTPGQEKKTKRASDLD